MSEKTDFVLCESRQNIICTNIGRSIARWRRAASYARALQIALLFTKLRFATIDLSYNLWWEAAAVVQKGTPLRKRTNKDHCRCFITIWSIGIARRRLNELIFVKTSNSTKTGPTRPAPSGIRTAFSGVGGGRSNKEAKALERHLRSGSEVYPAQHLSAGLCYT